ncbi:hypothetical protein BpHYR1_008141 [Brachionus plicatilis]|uniref:Uncharacterized protein n=1 Tax=Brachionus plicatilis TaxID=10195 RepID=A0A3M7PDK5_BRAPC|nr:hypothetical protein BpHYR1_008141 [Brachionus plicatilis]
MIIMKVENDHLIQVFLPNLTPNFEKLTLKQYLLKPNDSFLMNFSPSQKLFQKLFRSKINLDLQNPSLSLAWIKYVFAFPAGQNSWKKNSIYSFGVLYERKH